MPAHANRTARRGPSSSTTDVLDQELLTVAEVAELLKLSQQTVRSWITDGYLPALRLGRRLRILRSSLKWLLEESRV